MAGPTPSDLDQSKPGWYLHLMAPNTKGPPFAWLDPTRIYLFPESLDACTRDLATPFEGDSIDMVAGIDAVGFILGASIAQRLGKGFLALRNANKLCVETTQQPYTDYQKGNKCMEIRNNPFPEGTRVLVVDQWIETGGTMQAATKLIESQAGVVAGIAAICIEESPGGKHLKQTYRCVHCAPEGLQEQINQQRLESFGLFK